MKNQLISPVDFAMQCLLWSARLVGLYFVLRFVAVVLISSGFYLLFGGLNLYLLVNPILPVGVGLFAIGLYAAPLRPAIPSSQAISLSLIIARLAAVGLFALTLLFVWLGFVESNSYLPFILEAWSDVILFGCWFIGSSSVVGMLCFIYIMYRHALFTKSTSLWLLLALLSLVGNWMVLGGWWSIDPLASSFLLMIGVSWYWSAKQLVVLLKTGRDQPVYAAEEL